MDIELLLYENDKEGDFIKLVAYYADRIRISKINNETFSLQRRINKKLYDIYIVIETNLKQCYGSTTPLEIYTPVKYNKRRPIEWELVFKEHSEQQKLLRMVGCAWRGGFHSDPGTLEEVLDLQKKFNKILDELKMETWIDANEIEIALMHYVGYDYRTIDMDNQTDMKEAFLYQMRLNDDIEIFLNNLIKDIGTDQPPVEYSHKDIQEYCWITWEDIFEQYRIKQGFMARIEQLWHLRNETIDNRELENIIIDQIFIIENLRLLKCDLAKVYKKMFKF